MALLDAMTDELDGSDGEGEGDSTSTDMGSDKNSFARYFGRRAFLPGSASLYPKDRNKGGSSSPASIDPATMRLRPPPVMPGSGQTQIKTLRQLGAVAKAVSGLPPEIKNRILSKLLGMTYQDPHQSQYQQQTNQVLLRNMLAEPERRQKQMERQQSIGLRREGLQARQEDRSRGRDLQKQMLDFRKENQKSMLQLHKDQARNTITNSIANLTRAMEATTDPKMQLEIGKLLQKQHQLYMKFSDLDETENESSKGSEATNATQSGESTSTGRGNEY